MTTLRQSNLESDHSTEGVTDWFSVNFAETINSNVNLGISMTSPVKHQSKNKALTDSLGFAKRSAFPKRELLSF